MAEVSVAMAAEDFGPAHEQALVGACLDRVIRGRLMEAGPAGARVEFRVGLEQGLRAADAAVGALGLGLAVMAAESALGARLSRHLERLVVELATPVRIRFLQLLDDFSNGRFQPKPMPGPLPTNECDGGAGVDR
jgi:hypothetical protein